MSKENFMTTNVTNLFKLILSPNRAVEEEDGLFKENEKKEKIEMLKRSGM
jgi:hypothetical protein